MARQDLLEFLKQGLDALDFKGDVSLDWDKKSFVCRRSGFLHRKQSRAADGRCGRNIVG